MSMGYFGPTYSEYFLQGDYPGEDLHTRTLYRGSDKEIVSKKVESCINRVQAFQPGKKSSKMAGFTLYYRGKKYLSVKSVVGTDGVRRVVKS